MTEWGLVEGREHPDADELVELALGSLGAAEADRLAAHLVGCGECRAAYAAVEDGLQQALAAGPSIAPPPGFSGRVLAAMNLSDASAAGSERGPLREISQAGTGSLGSVAADRPGAAATRGESGRTLTRMRLVPPPRASTTRPRAPLVAASVLVGLLAGVGGTLAATGVLSGSAVAPGTATAPTASGTTTTRGTSATLLTASGDAVGAAGVTPLGGREYLAISVTRGRPGLDYECVLIDANGVRTSGGHWKLSDDYGSGQASGAWLVPLPDDRRPSRVEMIGPSGAVWSSATF